MQTQSAFALEKAHFHSTLGFLIPPDHVITSFDYTRVEPILQKLTKKSYEELKFTIENFPQLHLSNNFNYYDAAILKDYLVAILNRFLSLSREQQIQDQDVILHKNLCVPLKKVSQYLDVKKGMVINICYNFIPLNENWLLYIQKFRLKDFDLRYYISNNKEQEKLFFGASIVGSIHMARVIKCCYQIQQMIQLNPQNEKEIIQRLAICQYSFDMIYQEMVTMMEKLDPEYFNNQLRPLVGGFKQLAFLGVQDQNGQTIRITSSGGTGGYDPSFQLFQSAFGIIFEGGLKKTQDDLFQEGMTIFHKKAILWWRNLEKEKTIRNYFQKRPNLKDFYNKVLRKYRQYLAIHTQVIKKYIMNRLPDAVKKVATGTGGTKILEILQRPNHIHKQQL